MTVNLQKGQKISLSKEGGGALTRVTMGLGWDAIKSKGFLGFGGKTESVDLDASVVLFDESNRPVDVVWFRQLKSKDGSIVHTGDNRTGAGDGDDEALKIDLEKVPATVKRIVVAVTIHDADLRKQSFGQVGDAFMRIVNMDNDIEIARFDLSEDYSTETAMIFGEVYRHNDEWKFKAVGQGFAGGLAPLCGQFGVNVG